MFRLRPPAARIGLLFTGALGLACTRTEAPPPPAPPLVEAAAVEPAEVDAAVAASAPSPLCEPGVTVVALGRPRRILAVSDKPLDGELEAGTTSAVRRGGPPYFWIADAGTARARFTCGGKELAALAPTRHARTTEGVWPSTNAWSHVFENVYSAWIETLFDAPEGELPSWTALHEVLRDRTRNLLFDHRGEGEDSGGVMLRPDCADLPYFLRAYFAWKLELPFGLAECTRGNATSPPSCKGLVTNEDGEGPFAAFVSGTVANKAHSGSARTPFEDEAADYYPVKLAWDTLRPGTVYADPYGHVLMIAKRIAQTPERGGVLYAVDGQPDGTVARKRFWRGNFLFAKQRELGGPGFKHFRPIGRQSGHLVRLGDRAIARSPEYGDVSREVAKLDVEGFYDAMEDVLAPRPRDAERALLETIDSLEEQVRTRVVSVDNGRRWLEKSPPTAAMPEGGAIFETVGPWEDFSTPARDLRLLIAVDAVRAFPERVRRRADRFAGSTANLPALLERELARRSVSYTRSDGSPFTLTLAEVLARSSAFEMTYNPNDCVELRWGAPAESAEAAPCRAHAPADQRARMATYRAWFRDRRRPPRK